MYVFLQIFIWFYLFEACYREDFFPFQRKTSSPKRRTIVSNVHSRNNYKSRKICSDECLDTEKLIGFRLSK